jgi:hypothetical protein
VAAGVDDLHRIRRAEDARQPGGKQRST